jgi:hypothetical protein
MVTCTFDRCFTYRSLFQLVGVFNLHLMSDRWHYEISALPLSLRDLLVHSLVLFVRNFLMLFNDIKHIFNLHLWLNSNQIEYNDENIICGCHSLVSLSLILLRSFVLTVTNVLSCGYRHINVINWYSI